MFKKGDKVEVTGRVFTGQIGTIIRRDKLAEPGESQESVWLVKLPHVTYKFHETVLRPITD